MVPFVDKPRASPEPGHGKSWRRTPPLVWEPAVTVGHRGDVGRQGGGWRGRPVAGP